MCCRQTRLAHIINTLINNVALKMYIRPNSITVQLELREKNSGQEI